MILIALGANLPRHAGGSAVDTCRWAAARLDGLLGLRLRGLSRWYDSAPVPPSDQPGYVNGVALLAGEADPARLLRALQEIEAEGGRVRTVANASRTLDLDIIDMHSVQRRFPDPVLPHPRAHQRAFVLAPLLDVAPGWRHPVSGRAGAELLAEITDQPIRVLR